VRGSGAGSVVIDGGVSATRGRGEKQGKKLVSVFFPAAIFGASLCVREVQAPHVVAVDHMPWLELGVSCRVMWHNLRLNYHVILGSCIV
jgi:hypothetical protein